MKHSSLIKVVCAFIAMASWLPVKAEEPAERAPWEVSLKGGLYLENEQAWQLQPSAAYMFNRFFGASMGVEFTSQYNQPSRMTLIDGCEAVLAERDRNVAWMVFKPAAVLRSPSVGLSRDGYIRLWFQAEPGVSLACPFRNSLTYELKEFQGPVSYTSDYRRFSNKGLRWFYWNASVSANVGFDRFIVGLGYDISNFDYYSCRRNVTLANGVKFSVPAKRLSQSVFITIGYTL